MESVFVDCAVTILWREIGVKTAVLGREFLTEKPEIKALRS